MFFNCHTRKVVVFLNFMERWHEPLLVRVVSDSWQEKSGISASHGAQLLASTKQLRKEPQEPQRCYFDVRRLELTSSRRMRCQENLTPSPQAHPTHIYKMNCVENPIGLKTFLLNGQGFCNYSVTIILLMQIWCFKSISMSYYFFCHFFYNK